MRKNLIAAFVAVLAAFGCGNRQEVKDNQVIGNQENLSGDSIRYGLACDGCTDSILVFLPSRGDDLDTFDIIAAREQHHVYGRPHIGDELAVIVNPADTAQALAVVNLSTLAGEWCYRVTPTLRRMAGMTERPLPDSIRERIMVSREYSIRLKRGGSARSSGGGMRQQSDGMSPVAYPRLKRYTSWRLHNDLLILTADTIAGFSKPGDKPEVDTVSILLLRRDSLVLRFRDHEQGYYRRPVTASAD